jgi:lysozyme
MLIYTPQEKIKLIEAREQEALRIKRHEESGKYKQFPYKCPAGKLTIGWGRNLEGKGITKQEADFLFHNDFVEAEEVARKFCHTGWENLSFVRQGVIINMAFNLGPYRLAKFVNLRAGIIKGDIDRCIRSMEGSLWYKQVGDRGPELVKIFKEDYAKAE